MKRISCLLAGVLMTLPLYGVQDYKGVQAVLFNAWSTASADSFITTIENNLCSLPANRFDVAVMHLDELRNDQYENLNTLIQRLGGKTYVCGTQKRTLALHIRVFFRLHTITNAQLKTRAKAFYDQVLKRKNNAAIPGTTFHLSPILEDQDKQIGTPKDAYPGLVTTMLTEIPDPYLCRVKYVNLIRSHIPGEKEPAKYHAAPTTVGFESDCDGKASNGKETMRKYLVQHEIHGASVDSTVYDAWSNDGVDVYHPVYESETGTSDAGGGGSTAIALPDFNKATTSHKGQIVTLLHRPRYNLQLYKSVDEAGVTSCKATLPNDGNPIAYCASANSKDKDYRQSVQTRIDSTGGEVFDALEKCVLTSFLKGGVTERLVSCGCIKEVNLLSKTKNDCMAPM